MSGSGKKQKAEAADVIVASLPTTPAHFPAEFTAAECEVACHLVLGRRQAQIAELRGTSLSTVRAQVQAMIGKASVRSSPQLIARLARFDRQARRGVAAVDQEQGRRLWQGLMSRRYELVEHAQDEERRVLVARRGGHSTPGTRVLSEREGRVLHRVGQGASNVELGAELGVSPGAVATLLARGLRKLDVETRVELIWMAHTLTRTGPP